MKYLAVDFETTGLTKNHQPLTFCGILDTLGSKIPIDKLPKFEYKFAWEEVTDRRKNERGIVNGCFQRSWE